MAESSGHTWGADGAHDPGIIRYSESDLREREVVTGDADLIDAITDHITRTLGEPPMVFHETVSDQVHVDVHIVPATAERRYHVLVTSGMSERPMSPPPGHEDLAYAELCMALPPDWPIDGPVLAHAAAKWPFEWLRMLARFPHVLGSYLSEGHTVPNGDPPEPFHESTPFCCTLLLHPAPLPEAFRMLDFNGRTIHFYMVIPLTAEEMEVKLRSGVDSLIPGIASSDPASLAAPDRASFVGAATDGGPDVRSRALAMGLPRIMQDVSGSAEWERVTARCAPPLSIGSLIVGVMCVLGTVTIPIGIWLLLIGPATRRRRYVRAMRSAIGRSKAIYVVPLWVSLAYEKDPDACCPGRYLGCMDEQGADDLATLSGALKSLCDCTPTDEDPDRRAVGVLLSMANWRHGQRTLVPLSLTNGVRLHVFDVMVPGSTFGGQPHNTPIGMALVTPGATHGEFQFVPSQILRMTLSSLSEVHARRTGGAAT